MVSGLIIGGPLTGPGDVGLDFGGVVDAGDVEPVQGAELRPEPAGVGEAADAVRGGGVPAPGDLGLDGGVEFPPVQADAPVLVSVKRGGPGELVPELGCLLGGRLQGIAQDGARCWRTPWPAGPG